MKTAFFIVIILATAAIAQAQVKRPEPPTVKIPFSESLQAVIVSTAGPSAIQGKARLYERSSAKASWKSVSDEFPVVVGRNGMAWGEDSAQLSAQNEAPTLNPIFIRYCAAWENKDEATLRRFYSSATIKDFAKQMKDEGIKSLSEFLSEDLSPRESCRALNEYISGKLATAEIRTKGYPMGLRIVFVKENGEWKMTNKEPEALHPRKKEGDGKSPSGLFPLTTSFGRADKAAGISLPYTKLGEYTECVDDVNSFHYNKIVDRLQVGNFDWKSSEKMLEIGPAYDLGINVAHNSYPVVKGKGSCIFLHVWSNATTGTSGCTAMKREDLQKILAWADPGKNPYLVQMAKSDYKNLRKKWNLPKL